MSMAHFQRIGRGDRCGYWLAAIVIMFIPWNLASLAGVLVGGAIPDPRQFGLDVIFPGRDGGHCRRAHHRPARSRRGDLPAPLSAWLSASPFDPAVGIVSRRAVRPDRRHGRRASIRHPALSCRCR